jgi:YidC/Oxa1 family membrane protein insertase
MWDTIIINPFVNIILFIYQLFDNFGIAIILFTILIRMVTYPLTAKQLKGTAAMQTLQSDKRWIDIQKKYKNDKEKLAQEQMKLYKELGINPMASCLPTLIQFPIIIGLYQSIIRSLASTPLQMFNLVKDIYPNFLDVATLIPIKSQFLWMDLGQPERLFIPGIEIGIPVLAILVVITTYIQSKLMQPPQTNPQDQTAAMSGMMTIYIPFLMGYISYTLASGLALYFIVSNVIGVIQYAYMGKVNWSNLLPGRKSAQTK